METNPLQDLQTIGKDIADQAKLPGTGSRLLASSTNHNAVQAGPVGVAYPSTRPGRDEQGNVVTLQLWIPGHDPFDSEGFFFGDAPLPED